MHTSSPQAEQMADESMVRNLAAQAEAIWPQEVSLFARYPAPGRILDVGCGTGEISLRLAELYPSAAIMGVDLEASHLARARARDPERARQLTFQEDDALALSLPSGHFDLVVCRHLLHALPDASRALREMHRVATVGGWLHLLAEDYGMLWCHPTPSDADEFWQRVPQKYGAAIGCDNRVGRKMFSLLSELGLEDIRVDYVVVDTLRVPRDTFARIWEAWRDGYTDALVQHGGMPRDEVARRWEEMIACVRDPGGYALWQVPIWSACKARAIRSE